MKVWLNIFYNLGMEKVGLSTWKSEAKKGNTEFHSLEMKTFGTIKDTIKKSKKRNVENSCSS